MKTFSIFTCFFLLTANVSLAQEREYIVTNNNDTIYGELTRGTNFLNPSEVRFNFRDEQGNKNSISPAGVKAIRSLNGVDGDCFIATVYDRWFIKRIIDGRIKVYRLIDGALFYTSKNDSVIHYTEFGGFSSRKKGHAEIRPLIEDNPLILKEFDSLKGSEANILYIIEKYNSEYK